MTSRHYSRFLLTVAAVAFIFASGCGSRPGTVSGEVKYNGWPVPSGTITFLSEAAGKRVVSADIVDGRYTVAGLEPGPVRVTVVAVPRTAGGSPPNGGRPVVAPGVHAAGSGKFMPVNRRYASVDQSGLAYEVKPGPQVKDFDLPR